MKRCINFPVMARLPFSLQFAVGGAVESDFEIKIKAVQDISVNLVKGTVPPKWLGKKWGDKLMRLKIPSLIIPIGPVVIWFDNELSLVFKFTLELTPGHSTFGLSFKKSITIGTQYDHGKGWKDLHTTTGPGKHQIDFHDILCLPVFYLAPMRLPRRNVIC